MNSNYWDTIAIAGGNVITHIGLWDGASEITGGSYARKAVTWTAPAAGQINLNANLVFDIPAGATVTAWAAYSAITGGTIYGNIPLNSQPFATAGTYTLLAASTYIAHSTPA